MNKDLLRGSGGGSVGRAVASDTRDPRFESQHRQTLSTNCTLKDENKEKQAGNGPFKKKKDLLRDSTRSLLFKAFISAFNAIFVQAWAVVVVCTVIDIEKQ